METAKEFFEKNIERHDTGEAFDIFPLMDEYADMKIRALSEAMQEFYDRVDRGEVRSKYTYSKFKKLLQKEK